MKTVNIHEAKTHLSRLLERVRQRGEPFIIAKAGKPIAKVVAVDAPEPAAIRRLGFLNGDVEVPDDFDRMGESELTALFDGTDDTPA
jgi:prevent-host-death family protein